MPSQKKTPFILGMAQITSAPARNLDNFFSLLKMSQNKKVCVNLGRAPSNLGNAQKKRYFVGIPCLREIKFIVKMLDGWSKCPLYIYK